MLKGFFTAAQVAVEAGLMLMDEKRMREARTEALKLFEAQGIPFTTDTLHACYVGIALVLFDQNQAVNRHFMAGLGAIIHQRREVEAKANV